MSDVLPLNEKDGSGDALFVRLCSFRCWDALRRAGDSIHKETMTPTDWQYVETQLAYALGQLIAAHGVAIRVRRSGKDTGGVMGNPKGPCGGCR